MADGNVLHDGKAKARPTSSLTSALVYSVEALGKPRDMLRLDALPLISYGQGWITRVELPLHGNAVVITTVFERIHKQITHRTMKFCRISEDHIFVLEIGLDFAFRVGGPEIFNDFNHHIGHVNGKRFVRSLDGLNSRDRKSFV